VLIGREDAVSNIVPDVDLAPHGGEEGGVGRRHARITFSNGQYLIEDLNSINFTFVNKQKIAPKTPTPIKNGDEVRLGRVVLKFSAS
jgi:pSer/pThr/pTyr-binding forkhead associated (FHA) protein